MCKCFEAMTRPNIDRHSKPRMMQRLWQQYGIRSHPLYPLMRLIVPAMDTHRAAYRLKQKGLAKMFVTILAINEQSPDAQALLNWKKPSTGFQRNEQGNFPEVVYSVVHQRTKTRADLQHSFLTIAELNEYLDRLAEGELSDAKTEVMREIINRTTAREQRWVLRIVLKDMHIGMKEDSVFKLLHPDAKELYNTVCDLKEMCERCVDPAYRLKDIGITPFRPLKPQLAKREGWNFIHKLLSRRGEYVVEDKMDGERLMLHYRRGGEADGADAIKWFTRNCNDFTACYGEAMAPVLRECMLAGLDDCILDGEMMVWNHEEGAFSAFGDNRSIGDFRKRLDQHTQPCYIVFDCLWLNGEDMCKHPLPERRARASRFVAWRDHSLELLKQHRIQPHPDRQGVPTTTHTEEIMASLDAALGRGVEGVVFKSLGTPYVPGGREGDWIKLKPDYVPDMSDELDVLIIAGYYGEGVKRGGAISHFLLGVLAPASEKHKHPNVGYPHIYPFAKVGTGYSQKALAELRARLEDGQHVWQKNQRPRHLCGWVPNKTDDEPDVWFEPAKSVILSVQAYEIVKGEAFLPSAYTLRFPRVRKIRYDKPWNECERFEDLALRFEEGRAKISASRRSATDVARADPKDLKYGGLGGKHKNKDGKAAGAAMRQVGVLSHMRVDTAALHATKVEADVLGGAVVVVRGFGATDPTSKRSKKNLQLLVKRLGGELHANPTERTSLVVSADDKPTPEVRADIEDAVRRNAEGYDIVKPSWLFACEEAGTRLPLEPRYVLYASPDSRAAIASIMDEWGDRYREPATSASLTQAMELVRRRQQLPAPPAQAPPVSQLLPPHKKQKTEESSDVAASHSPLTKGPSAETLANEAFILRRMGELPDEDVAHLCSATVNALLGVTAYSPRAAMRIRLRLLGATVVALPSAQVSHAVLPTSSASDGSCAGLRAALTKARMQAAEEGGGTGSYAYIIREEWVAACEAAGSRVGESVYLIHEARVA